MGSSSSSESDSELESLESESASLLVVDDVEELLEDEEEADPRRPRCS